MEPNELTATQARARIAAGELTAETLARACLARIHEREPDVAAWGYVNPAEAIAAARRVDAAGAAGLLGGIPVGFKDIVDTEGMPTTYGSPIYRDHRPAVDAVCVANTRRAGGYALGKTITTEFASRYPGPTRNPNNLGHSPGGSSSGSAAAVADHMVPLAIGTQTAGSVIRPASYCGIVGYKPSFGLLSFSGVRHLAESLDTLGCMARTVEDAALFRSALLGSLRAIPLRVPDLAPRIGLCRTPLWHEADPSTQSLIEGAANALRDAGADVHDVELPDAFTDSMHLHHRVSRFEVARALMHDFLNQPENLSASARESVRIGLDVEYEEYVEGLRTVASLRETMDAVCGGFDILITPSAPGEAPHGNAFTGAVPFNYLWTLMHTPAVTLPVLTGPNGLPVGLQVVGRRLDDDRVLGWAEWISRRLS